MNNKNEVRKLRELMQEGLRLGSEYQKPSPVVDIPSKIFSEFRKRRKQIQDSLEDY